VSFSQSLPPLLCGVDVGSTNIKAVIFDEHGTIVAQAARKTPTHFPRPGWAYYRPRELWQTTAAVLRDATAQVEQPHRIVGVGVASIGESGVLIDGQGNELYDAIAWYDVRSEPQGEQVVQVLGAERVYAITGITPQAIFGLCKLLWIQQHEPELFARAERYLHVADYIAWKLCGEAATDYSLASRTLALDLHNLRWSDEILTGMGIPPEIFAPLRRGGELLGRVLAEAAEDTGLPAGAAVAVGGHDHLCGGLAIGAGKPGALLDSVGTAEAVLLTIERPLQGERVAQEGYEQGAHVAAGYYGMGAYRTAGVCIDWFRTTCAAGADYATLTAEAEAAPLGSLGVRFVPHMRLPHSPSNDPKARGLFLGLSTDVTRGMMFRAILEGLAFETRNVLEPLLRYAGVARPSEIFLIGGAGRNPLFAQIKASILQQRLTLATLDEETATGAALLGGMAAGLYVDADAAHNALHVQRTYVEPDPEQAEQYERIFRTVYQQIYPALRTVQHANFALR
jgi:xylulokinase